VADAALLQRLLAAWREPQRRYHTLQHLAECVAAFAPPAVSRSAPGEVELALWFHDAIYDVHRHDNEARAPPGPATRSTASGAGADAATRVHDLVLATRHAAARRPPTRSCWSTSTWGSSVRPRAFRAVRGADPRRVRVGRRRPRSGAGDARS
jgi:predicted metal-dependent HD superfamily phosphohydrolase